MEQTLRQRIGTDGFETQRVQTRTVIVDAVIEVRSGREHAGADVADHFALHDFSSRTKAFHESREVEIVRIESRCMAEANVISFAALASRFDHDAIGGPSPPRPRRLPPAPAPVRPG